MPDSVPPATALQIAREAAHSCGTVLRDRFGTISYESKAGGVSHDLVTEADVESERTAVRLIKQAFPDHAILGEENATAPPPEDPAAEPSLWIIDPLDGTNNFAHGVPHFAVSIGYYERGEAVAGVVLNPAHGDLFSAARGQGAFAESTIEPNRDPVRLTVGTETSLDHVLIGCGFYYDRGPMMKATLAAVEEVFGHGIHGIRRMGTASLDLCAVAAGQFGAFFEYQLQPWDFAAGRLILSEAGGRVSNAFGDPLPLAATSILASNGPLHELLLPILKSHGDY